MQFGLDIFPDKGPDLLSPADFYAQCLDLTELADKLGYYSVKIVEHYFYAYGGYSPNPLLFLSAAAQRTRRLRLITGCVLPAFSHPLKLAAELATVDAISGGRLEAGFARAFIPGEFSAFGVPMDESRGRFDEGVAAVLDFWTKQRTSLDGPFHQYRDVPTLPPPTQRPHPPVWVATIATPQSFINCGERGYNLMVVPYLAPYEELKENIDLYREAYRKAGHGEVKPEQIMMVFHTFVAPTREEAYAICRPAMQHYINVFLEAASSWDTTVSKDYAHYDLLPKALRAMTFDRVIAEKRAAIGTPDDVYEAIREVTEYFGCGHLTLQHFFGTITYEQARATMELFAREVMPRFN